MFYVIDSEITRLALGRRRSNILPFLWRRPGELVGRFYNVNVYNMYILLDVFNEEHMLD